MVKNNVINEAEILINSKYYVNVKSIPIIHVKIIYPVFHSRVNKYKYNKVLNNINLTK